MFYALASEKTSIEDSLSIFIAIAPCTLISNTEDMTARMGADYYWWIDKLASSFDIKNIENPDRYSLEMKYEFC